MLSLILIFQMSINNNNNNKKLSVKHNDEVMDAFNLFDKDHDKRINSEEILSLIAALGGDTECQHVQDLVLACELNHGSLGEYSAVVQLGGGNKVMALLKYL